MNFEDVKTNAISLCEKKDTKIIIENNSFEIYGITFYDDLKIRNNNGWFEADSFEEMWKIIQILV